MSGGGRAWRHLRRHRGYRDAWRSLSGPAAFESAGFALRAQSEADRAAARFGLLAWEDPFDEAGPASPFWSEAPVALAMVAPPGLAGATLAEAMVRDGSLRAAVRRRVDKATFLMEAGYRDLAAGRRLRPQAAWAAKRPKRG